MSGGPGAFPGSVPIPCTMTFLLYDIFYLRKNSTMNDLDRHNSQEDTARPQEAAGSDEYQQPATGRKPFAPPQLERLGDVVERTQWMHMNVS